MERGDGVGEDPPSRPQLWRLSHRPLQVKQQIYVIIIVFIIIIVIIDTFIITTMDHNSRVQHIVRNLQLSNLHCKAKKLFNESETVKLAQKILLAEHLH